MSLFTLTINNLSPALDKQNHEVERIHRYLNAAAQDVRGSGGKKTSGNILDPGGVTVVGSWTYTPQAST
ncbi:MAG TPA: hypothetical protein VE999_19505 [Gemmataceae bacterium]|nr:hypothetical protein [Gemmataceae bacterium]